MATAYCTLESLRRRSGSDLPLASIETLELRGGERAGRIKRLENIATLKSLRTLDLSGNLLSSLAPLGAAAAPALTSLDVSGNRLTTMDGLQTLAGSLRSLALTSNEIEQLPNWIGSMRCLQRLGIAHNKLVELSQVRTSILCPLAPSDARPPRPLASCAQALSLS
jgi:hypothetical protein